MRLNSWVEKNPNRVPSGPKHGHRSVRDITPHINIKLDRNDWFWRDHYKYTIYTTSPDTGKTVTSHSPRIYYWEDEGTDYYMFAQEIVTILSELDIWYKEKYQHDNIENNNSLKKIIDWYEMMHRMYEKVCENSDTEDEDSIS